VSDVLITEIDYDGQTLVVRSVRPGFRMEIVQDAYGNRRVFKNPAWIEWTETYTNASVEQYNAWFKKFKLQ